MRTTRSRAAGYTGKAIEAGAPSPTALASEPAAAAAVQSASLAQVAAPAVIPVVAAEATKATAPKRAVAAAAGVSKGAAKLSRWAPVISCWTTLR